jgi:ATP-binding cassette subfamily B (MDR/TAP) protein 8
VNGIVLGVLYAGGQMLVAKEIDAGQMMAYLSATQIIQRSFTQISILFGQALRGLSSGARVFEVKYKHMSRQGKKFNLNLIFVIFKFLKLESLIQVDDSGVKLTDLKGHINFKNVSFTYPNRKEMVRFPG